MQWLKSADYKIMKWKNGGGETREIALASSEDDTLAWRLSIATIARSGPFSLFPGIDRSIVLLDGDGVVLNVAGDGRVVLDKNSGIYRFDGGVAVEAQCMGGKSTDLNMMTRRGLYCHHMQRLTAGGELVIDGAVEKTFVVFADRARVAGSGKAFDVCPFDTVILPEKQEMRIIPLAERVRVFAIFLWRGVIGNGKERKAY